MIPSLETFFQCLHSSLESNTFVKITTSEKREKKSDLKSISIKRITIKQGEKLSFTYRYKTKDIVKNYDSIEATKELETILHEHFGSLELFTTSENLKLTMSADEKIKIKVSHAEITKAPEPTHDKQKKRYIETSGNIALQELGILNERFEIIPSMQDKFKQIDKFLEIIDGLLRQAKLPENFRVADM